MFVKWVVIMIKKMICCVVSLAIILIFCSFFGCSVNNNFVDNVDIGIILPTKEEERWLQDCRSFESKLKDVGYKSQILFSQGDLSIERTNIETLIVKNVKVLIICPHDVKAVGASVEQAKEAGVSVISYDKLITGTDALDYYVTFDSKAVGEIQGKYLCDNAPKNKKKIPLYLYAGAVTDSNAYLYFEGAWEKLQPKIKDGTFVIANSSEALKVKNKLKLSHAEQNRIIEQLCTNWDGAIAKSLAEEHLTKADDSLKGDVLVLAPNDAVSRPVADVLRSDDAITSYVVTGQDVQKDSVICIRQGLQSMSVFKDTRMLASEAVNMAIDILQGKKPRTNTTYNNEKKDVKARQLPIDVVTKSNIKEKLIDSGYYQESDIE